MDFIHRTAEGQILYCVHHQSRESGSELGLGHLRRATATLAHRQRAQVGPKNKSRRWRCFICRWENVSKGILGQPRKIISQGHLISSAGGSRRPGMHQPRARERARAREREQKRAIAEEKHMEEKLEAAIRSATACVKQVEQDLAEDPKVNKRQLDEDWYLFA
jgi:hypothetical protein